MKLKNTLGIIAAFLYVFGVIAANAQSPAYRISTPHTHKNLTIFLIHGKNETSKTNIITLPEALERKLFRVYETSDVNELTVENISKEFDVFIQSGDIVKGGKQDRVLAISIIIPARSGRVSIEAFCVESGRWEKRKSEDASQFSSSNERIVTKDLKLAANGARSQSEVWAKVAEAQKSLSDNVGAPVRSETSSTSLQLSLENGKVSANADEYVRALSNAVADKTDVIGYAFAVNGQLNSADIYVSNALFKKLWPRMLKAAAVEAVAASRGVRVADGVKAGDVKSFLADADKGHAKERSVTGNASIVTREENDNVVFEARDDKSKLIVHRNYVKKNP
ncbi:MAG: ARPP-1 family domain-containing protein [Pyrinomonadaceae bacterium]